MKIYYLTRSYLPYQKTGGSLIRNGSVKFLQELGWNITVVMPNYNSKEIKIENNVILIPQNYNIKFHLYMERLGLKEDYLDKWVKVAFEYLKDKIQKDDIVLATSGGELGMIKLGSLLKNAINCKFVVNFHDPLDYSLVHGIKQDGKFHIGRENQEQKYLSDSDLIITSSVSNQNSLQNKYPFLKDKIRNNYFGYIQKLDIKQKREQNTKVTIAYVGNMGGLQKPELLYKVYESLKNRDKVEIYFIGDISSNKTLQNIKKLDEKNINFIDSLPHDEFLKFMSDNIDVGFVSLTSDYLGACVPSKIYEYINLELPILGALPDGDGKDIINQNKYGIACAHDDLDCLVQATEKFIDKIYLDTIKLNIQTDKDEWFMKNRILEVDEMLRDLIDAN